MLNFPQSTEYNKKIPKEKFYAKLDISPSIKRIFVNEIDQIVWRNKLALSTVNISRGVNVIEINILEVKLKKKYCNYSLFEFLDKNLPNYTVFVLTFADEAQLFINYKEAIENRIGKHKITTNYKTDWGQYDDFELFIEGLNLDRVYENFVTQIAGSKLILKDDAEIKDAIAQSQKIERLQKEISTLESKIRNEKQFNIQVQLSAKLKTLNLELDKLGLKIII